MYHINEEKMFYDMADGVAVVIDFTTGVYYSMDELGSVTLDVLLRGAAENAVLNSIRALPGCPDDIDARFNTFMQKLFDFGIVLGDGNGESCAPFDPALAEKGFELSCDSFSEVMDLIMADPIHDVEPEQGWPFVKES